MKGLQELLPLSTGRLVVLMALLVVASTAPSPTHAEEPIPGKKLLVWCGGVDEAAPMDPRCVAYMQGALHMVLTFRELGAVRVCPPDDLTVERAVALYKSESKTYPEVMDTPAADLIAGMVVKFFPCSL